MEKKILKQKRKLEKGNQTSVKGITLVALVITIVILLILAGVAVSMITGEDGIFERADAAASKYEKEAESEADRLTDLIERYLDGIPELTSEQIAFTYVADRWVNVEVKVKIEAFVEGYTLQYSIDKGITWHDYEEEVSITENGKQIWARLINDEGILGTAKKKIENLDKDAPNPFTLTPGIGDTTITVTGSTTDKAESKVSGMSGIKGYQFSIDGGDWTEITPEGSYTFTGLKGGSTHTVVMKAIDNAGNETLTPEVEVTTEYSKLATAGTVGSYVSYPVTYSNVATYTGYVSSYNGWRIMYNDGTTVKLVSAGTPLAYYHSTNASSTVNTLKNNFRDAGYSANGISGGMTSFDNEFTASVAAMTKADLDNVWGSTTGDRTSVSSNNILNNGSYYWMASTGSGSVGVWCVYGNGVVNFSSEYKFGIRPVVTLKENIIITDGAGTSASPYVIKLAE